MYVIPSYGCMLYHVTVMPSFWHTIKWHCCRCHCLLEYFTCSHHYTKEYRAEYTS